MIKLGVVAGDGVGPEVTAEGLEVLSAVARIEGIAFRDDPVRPGGRTLPEDRTRSCPTPRSSGCAAATPSCSAPSATPTCPPAFSKRESCSASGLTSTNISTSGLFSFIRGVECPIKGKGPDDIDMVVVRENNEDLYVGAGGFTRKGTPEEVAIQTSINTRAGVERTIRFAFERASRRAALGAFRGLSAHDRRQGFKRQVTLVAKTNVLTFAHDLWMRTFTEVSRDYPEIKSDYQHVDACCMRMVTSPERFDVIVTTNMFGDIITDLGAVLQGGMGLAASGNLNPDRTAPSMFEPVHGSAPDIAGKGIANPLAVDPLGGHDARPPELPGRGRAGSATAVRQVLSSGRLPEPPTWAETRRPRPSARPFASALGG